MATLHLSKKPFMQVRNPNVAKKVPEPVLDKDVILARIGNPKPDSQGNTQLFPWTGKTITGPRGVTQKVYETIPVYARFHPNLCENGMLGYRTAGGTIYRVYRTH